MKYDYFGNTTLRPQALLYNIEKQLFLFDELFKTAKDDDEWSGNNTILQEKYYYMLIDSGLLNTKTSLVLGTKDARAKSSPLENLNLINRSFKLITPLGRELLEMLKSKEYLKHNNFLQIDLVSLFFLKAFFGYSKTNSSSPINDFGHYINFFRLGGGYLTNEQFLLLPLFRNLPFGFRANIFNKNLNYHDLIEFNIRRDKNISLKKENFLTNYQNGNYDLCQELLKSSNGGKSGQIAFELLQTIIKIKTQSCTKFDIEKIFKNKIGVKDNKIKTQYMKYLLPNNVRYKDESSLNPILEYFSQNSEIDLLSCFYEFIEICRCKSNLKDYADLNKRYLSLTGIFEFDADRVSIVQTMKILINSFPLRMITNSFRGNIQISEHLFDDLFSNTKIISLLSQYGLKNTTIELKDYKYNQDKNKLNKLIAEKFTKKNLTDEILPLFQIRSDKKINSLVTNNATIPTIYEYVIALSWYYIDNKNIDFILQAGLSLDNDMLPKSHAAGGSADFEYDYNDHNLMIEVTLTDSTNQRRAEMESVSRHLGNMLLNTLDTNKRDNSYAIFIAPHLDRNVLNDFRSRRIMPWENSKGQYIEGMSILPFTTEDIIEILYSNENYRVLKEEFKRMINCSENRGSQWYLNTIKPFIESLNS